MCRGSKLTQRPLKQRRARALQDRTHSCTWQIYAHTCTNISTHISHWHTHTHTHTHTQTLTHSTHTQGVVQPKGTQQNPSSAVSSVQGAAAAPGHKAGAAAATSSSSAAPAGPSTTATAGAKTNGPFSMLVLVLRTPFFTLLLLRGQNLSTLAFDMTRTACA
jgi:hypothetical protein